MLYFQHDYTAILYTQKPQYIEATTPTNELNEPNEPDENAAIPHATYTENGYER